MLAEMDKAQFLREVFEYTKGTEWVYRGKVPCLIDFYTDGCPACGFMEGVVQKLSAEYEGRMRFLKVNADIEKELTQDLGIESFPCLLFCPMEGKPLVTAGVAPKAKLKTIIDRELGDLPDGIENSHRQFDEPQNLL